MKTSRVAKVASGGSTGRELGDDLESRLPMKKFLRKNVADLSRRDAVRHPMKKVR